jgi:hypothetical protein
MGANIMSFYEVKDGKILEYSCTEAEAIKRGLKEIPSNFQRSIFYPHQASSYNEDLTPKTEEQLIEDGIISDNRGTYYKTDTAQKIVIDKLNIDKPENVTELAPLEVPCKWDGDKWVDDTEEIERQSQLKEDMKDITKANPLLRAVALVMADLTGKTPQEMKQLIIDKYNTLE